ncbi:MAG: matrixin family metalloprotease, partial [Gracilimonas sp.]
FLISLILVMIPVGSIYAQDFDANYVGYDSSTCSNHLTWRIGNIDSRFNLTRNEVLVLMNEVEQFWQLALNGNVLQYDDQGDIALYFIYGKGQEYTDKENQLIDQIKYERQKYYVRNLEYNHRLKEYERAVEHLNGLQTRYNQLVSKYNTTLERVQHAGALSRHEKDELSSLKTSAEFLNREIESEKGVVFDAENRLEKISEVLNVSADEVNGLIYNYQINFNTWKDFKLGVYMKIGNEQKINIYQFDNKQALQLLLTHEFGHAFGIPHSKDSESVMYHSANQQNLNHYQLTIEDFKFINSHCDFKSAEIAN